MTDRLLVQGGQIVTPSGVVEGDLLVEGGKIRMLGRVPQEAASGARSVDAAGRLVLPGLVDVHVQGAGGCDILSDDPDDVARVRRNLASFGTTSFLATTAIDVTTGDQPHVRHVLREAAAPRRGARLLGIHLEGPFVSIEKRGMIEERFICAPDGDRYAWVKELCGGRLRMMTIAPELPGALEIIADLTASGIVASLGHSDATYDETVRGIEAGISHVTHIGNAMRSMHHREPGAFGAALMSEVLSAQVIADGIHLHPQMMSWIIRLKGLENCAIITDGIGAMGMPDGTYSYGGLTYAVNDGAARYLDGTLIGTAITQLQMVRRVIGITGLPLHDTVAMASLVPVRILGVEDRLGSLEPDKEADFLICGRDLNVEAVFIGAEQVA
ncbi:MAG: N-acetylglucosamine-6-phosphate deacetylase [Candidatus Brocadiia bacterium]|jgi:N-acetylglucosamine-6-phosphate deacetylase|nr:N-acetylglucosamine-6-phosphate deacetylase [Candidatus Brocadiia bacterium]